MYYVYMLRCEDNSIYTGITTNLKRRMLEHFGKNDKCAKYTLSHHAKKMEVAWQTEDRISASKLEYHIKKGLTKAQKEKLIKDNNLFENFLGEKIECKKYKRVEMFSCNQKTNMIY